MSQKRYVVLTDSACDLPPELEQKHGVEIMNFEITVDGKSYTERVDFDFDQYYDILRTCERVPATAHVTQTRFLDRFEEYDKKGIEEVLYVSINSTGSATHAAALLAEKEFRSEHPASTMKIHIVDSHTYSMAYGWFVSEVARKLNNGAEMADAIAWLTDMLARVDVTLAAFTLKFMKKSGRISAAAAFAGELLGLRPIISLTDGTSVIQKKVRGDKEVLPTMMDFTAARMDETAQYAIGGTKQEQIEELAALCKKKWKAEPYCTFKLGAAVATNTGPDAIAIVYLGEKRR